MKEDKKKGIGLVFALNGLRIVFINERNFRIHLLATILVIIASIYFKLSGLEWMFIFISIGLVLITELINSAIERMIDYLKPDIHPEAKAIKDLAAAAVLTSAILSVIVGLIIFLPKILNL